MKSSLKYLKAIFAFAKIPSPRSSVDLKRRHKALSEQTDFFKDGLRLQIRTPFEIISGSCVYRVGYMDLRRDRRYFSRLNEHF